MPEQDVKIVEWPKTEALLSHRFSEEAPAPVRITFEEPPAHVRITSEPEQPLNVNMNVGLAVRDVVPVCIKLCEPICAESDYRIGIDIFDRPVANISIKGLTRLFNCREVPARKECVDFKNYPVGETFQGPLQVSGLTFAAISGELRTVSYGEPAGQTKLGFNDKGVRIDFGGAVQEVSVVISNYGSPRLEVQAFSGTAVVETQTVDIANTAQRVNLQASSLTSLTVSGGSNEAAIVEVCYTRGRKAG